MVNGFFISFEGGEGAGKTTLIEEVYKIFLSRNHSVIKTREPGGTELGEAIRTLLLHSSSVCPKAELCLFLASRAQHIQEVIAPHLEEGKIILCDRFNDSSIAYQGVGRGLGFESVQQFCSFISGTVQPNLTLYLDLDPEVGLSRQKDQKQDRIEAEKISFHNEIRAAYHRLAKENPERLYLLDASWSPDKVLQQALKIINKHFSLD